MKKADAELNSMTSKLLLAIDLSTKATGFAVFEDASKKLIDWGVIKGKNFTDSAPYRALVFKLDYMATQVLEKVEQIKPHSIVVEEISGGGNRISQKTLDMQHGFFLWKVIKYLDIITYHDVTGALGWRTLLDLRLTDADKLNNKEAKKVNKMIGKGQPKLPIVGPKHLACRFVNKEFGLDLDCEERTTDGDVADAICLGYAKVHELEKKCGLN